ncbi:MAG TPA: M20/M25/M40 family metallo-hydrolase [Pyrinomonadaceae bacterium]|jgi:Zn-dependent M28 family amino/carboxypeptidase
MRRKILQLALGVVLAASVFAQQNSSQTGNLDIKRLRQHVGNLASVEMEGRRTGTEGAMAAAVYIANRFYDYGLDCPKPNWMCHHTSNNHLGYMKDFPYVSGVELGKANVMTFTSRVAEAARAHAGASSTSLDLRLREDWMPLAWSANARLENAPVTYVGYGLTATDLQHDDYAGVDVRGRIALAFAGTPDGDNPHGRFARFTDLRFKASTARDHGASALVLIAREENFRDDKLALLRIDESIAAGDAGLPVVVISRQAARRALEAAASPALTFAELEKTTVAGASLATGRSETQEGASTTTPHGQAATARRNLSAPLENIAFSLSTEIVRRTAPAANVVGLLEGSDAKLKHEVVVIGAHYDHLGRGGQGSLAGREGDIHHGADDNASGVAGLLELARTLAAERKSLRRTHVFIAFSGEEEGLLGSNYYVRSPSLPLAQTVAMINLDMIGRMRDGRLNVGGVGTAKEWRQWIETANSSSNLAASASASDAEASHTAGASGVHANARADAGGRFTLSLTEDGFGPSDHSSFYAKQIPVLFFWTGTHEDYHKPTDTADRINYEGQLGVVALVKSILRAVDASDARPTYQLARSDATARRSNGFRVYVGTIPSYAESTNGMKLDAVSEGSPAAKAGLLPGDVIVRVAGRDVRNVYDYTYALGEMRAGTEYEVEVMRGGERLKLKLTPAAARK